MIRKLAHLCLISDQLDNMLRFYTQQLGFSVKFAFKNADKQIFGYYLSCGDSTFVEIFDRVLKNKQWGGTLVPLHGGGGPAGDQVNHFCFEVTGLPQLIKTLESRGVKIGNVKTAMDHSHQAWTADPDGNLIEFMEYTYDSWQLQGADAG